MNTISNTSVNFMAESAVTPLPKFEILGQPVNLAEDYASWSIARLDRGLGTHVVTMNAEIVIYADRHPDFAKILQQADLITPDGSGIILALWLHGIAQKKCAGIELGEELLQLASQPEHNYPVFFYGGKPQVAAKAAKKWQTDYPSLNIVGIEHGYLNSEEQVKLKHQLVDTQPKIILVAMGVPRQELWIREHFHLCPQSIWIGVGGSFDVWSGEKKRAPKLVRHLNLEWCYRVIQEPSRWQRILALPQFVVLALGERLRSKGKLVVES